MREAMFSTPATRLRRARLLSHAAVQWASRAARANLPARADDSHSNLGWSEDLHALVSHALDESRRLQLGFSFPSAALIWLVDGQLDASLRLDAAEPSTAQAWCDEHLAAAGLRATGLAEMPYELAPVDYGAIWEPAVAAELEALGAWYSTAQVVLDGIVEVHASRAVVAPSVRCWPHHFDLATLLLLDHGDPETARSVGVGLSPGDESYAEPYFYCTPWPTPENLPDAPASLHWHREGFVSLILPAERVHRGLELGKVLTSAVNVACASLESGSS